MSAAEKLPDAANPLRNAKHEAVLQHYFADPARVGYKAYLAVYPSSSDGAAKTAFSRLLKNAEFAARLKFLDAGVTEKVIEASAVSIERVVNELARVGFATARNYLRILPNGEPAIDLSDCDEDALAALAEVTVEDFVDGRGDDARDVRRVKFRIHNKQAALVSILDHLGGFPAKKHELTGKDGGPIKAEVDQAEPLSDLALARRILFALDRGARAAEKPKKPKGEKQ